MKLNDLARILKVKCDEQDIIYDVNVLPIKVGPDCYLFYATPRTDDCVKNGACKVLPYYVTTGGETIEITCKSK